MNDVKICRRCQEELPITKFHRNKNAPGGYHNVCTRCRYLSMAGVFTEQLKRGPAVKDPLIAFWENVDKSGSCWIWTGAFDSRGTSPKFHFKEGTKNKQVSAPRWAFEYQFGFPIPKGINLFRQCGNSRCVKPGHMSCHNPRGGRNLD